MAKTDPFDEILKAAGITPEEWVKKTEHDDDNDIAHKQIKLIVKVTNGTDGPEPIYYPWFWKEEDASKPSGFGLSFCVYGYVHSLTGVAPRLKYRRKEDCRAMAKKFLAIYERYLGK